MTQGAKGISRFSCLKFPHMLQAFDSAGWRTKPLHGVRAELGPLSIDMVLDQRGGESLFYREGKKLRNTKFSDRMVRTLTRFFRQHGLTPGK